MLDLPAASATLVVIVHGLQLACLVTWGAVIAVHGAKWWRFLRGSDDWADQRWASICEVTAVQIGCSLRWQVWPSTADRTTDSWNWRAR